MLPHLLVVGAVNSGDPSSVGLRIEVKRGTQWRWRPPDRGGDRAPQLPLHVLVKHPRSNGTEVKKEGGAGSGAVTNRGLKGARFGGVAAEDRVRCEESVREPAAAATGVSQHQPYTYRQGAGRSCPTREGLMWRGRSEAVRDCAVTTELSRRPPQNVWDQRRTGARVERKMKERNPLQRGYNKGHRVLGGYAALYWGGGYL